MANSLLFEVNFFLCKLTTIIGHDRKNQCVELPLNIGDKVNHNLACMRFVCHEDNPPHSHVVIYKGDIVIGVAVGLSSLFAT